MPGGVVLLVAQRRAHPAHERLEHVEGTLLRTAVALGQVLHGAERLEASR